MVGLKILSKIIVSAAVSFICFCPSARAEAWKELKSDHFIVFFTADEKFAKEVLDTSEKYYRLIASELGYERYSEFWTWDKRVKIEIYPDHPAFIKATGQPKWAQGMADYRNKKIVSFSWSQGFLESLLPHEMTHLIFRDFVGFKGEVPLWLDEGVAQWAEKEKKQQVRILSVQTYLNDGFLSLEDMMKLDVRKVTSNDKIYIRSTRTKAGESTVLFLSGDNLVNIYYLQSASLVGFLIERYGSVSFIDFCRQLRDGKSLEEALRYAYSGSIEGIGGFENTWRAYLENVSKEPVERGEE